jgi:hypothetical protein
MPNSSHEESATPRSLAAPPKSIKSAGVILIVAGGLVLAIAAYGLLQVYLFVQRTNQGGAWCDSWIFVFPALVGYLLLRQGVRYVRGLSGDTLLSGIVSSVLGLPIGGFSGMFLANALWDSATGSGANAMSAPFRIVLGSMGVVAGLGMLAAGVLALIGRNAYRDWKRGNAR